MAKKKITIKDVYKDLAISDTEIAEFFGYANRHSYATSTRKDKVEKGVIMLYSLIVERYKTKKETKP